MANAGPNTNGRSRFFQVHPFWDLTIVASQFFITTASEDMPWLDNKHTIFGRAHQGLDVIHRIENAKVYKEKPEEDIKIVNISIT